MGSKKVKSSQVFILAALILLILIATVLCIGLMVKYEVITDVTKIEIVHYWKENLPKEQALWYDNGIEELQVAIKLVPKEQKARNVLIFVTNGITPEALAAVRFNNMKKQNEEMIWDKFPYMARLMNSCSASKMCDASTVATALFGGIKTNYGVGGLDSAVAFRDCKASTNVTHYVSSIVADAQNSGRRTGMVTTGRLTAPFIAPLYAHTADSSWECDSTIPSAFKGDCTDVAQQLISNKVAKDLNVIMGGGRQTLVSNTLISNNDPIDQEACRSTGIKRNLIRDWTHVQLEQKRTFAVAHNEAELNQMNGSYVDYAFGIFGNGHIDTNFKRFQSMISKSIDVLQREDAGFMLFVNNFMKGNESIPMQIEKLEILNDVIEHTLNLTTFSNEETLTLVIFTQGHHRGSSLDTNEATDVGLPLSRLLDTDSLELILSDTLVFATGPKSYLFHGVRDETYIKYALTYINNLDKHKKKS